MKQSNLFFLLTVLIHFSISTSIVAQERTDSNFNTLRDWMTGSFSSAEQAKTDTNFLDIRLEMVQIWHDRNDGIWLYVEQAAAWALKKPYRQRVYRIAAKPDNTYESAVFELPDPLRFAGRWNEENAFSDLTPDSLILREGCAITLSFTDSAFVGSTDGKRCLSTLRGASYATSEVRIEENVLNSWDRGFDKKGNQVWGSANGPYIFKKIKNY